MCRQTGWPAKSGRPARIWPGGTVYNTLNQFTEAGLLRRVTVHNEHSVFDTNTDHHHHFYDSARDQLIDIPADEVTLAALPGAPEGHDIKSVDVLIHITSREGLIGHTVSAAGCPHRPTVP